MFSSSRHPGHAPVLLEAAVEALAVRGGRRYVDATFGGGGYTRAILATAGARVCAIDRDPRALAGGAALADEAAGRLSLVEGRFGDLRRLLAGRGIATVDGGIVFDLGVSSLQLDDEERGFGFRRDGPLDMRFGPDGATAADAVNGAGEAELADIFFRYGEERRARRVAAAIVAARGARPVERTAELAAIVRSVVPRSADGLDPATRCFQALRIYVNDELGELRRALPAAEQVMAAGARLVVVAFHSLEDRLVKRFLARRARPARRGSRHLAPFDGTGAPPPASFRLLRRRAVRPGARERRENPRARSARLRAAERTGAPPFDEAAP